MCFGDNSRVCREKAVDIGVDLADVSVQGSRKRNRGRIGAASAQGRHVLIIRNSLESSDNCDLSFRDRAGNALGNHAGDLCAAVCGGRVNACLCAGEGLRGNSQLIDRHGQKRHGNTLPGGEKDVHLAFGRIVCNLRGSI